MYEKKRFHCPCVHLVVKMVSKQQTKASQINYNVVNRREYWIFHETCLLAFTFLQLKENFFTKIYFWKIPCWPRSMCDWFRSTIRKPIAYMVQSKMELIMTFWFCLKMVFITHDARFLS